MRELSEDENTKAFAAWCAEFGATPNAMDAATTWVRTAFEGGLRIGRARPRASLRGEPLMTPTTTADASMERKAFYQYRGHRPSYAGEFDAFKAGAEWQARAAISETNASTERGMDELVNRFLAWELPRTFAPDCGIGFDGRKDDEWNKNRTWPVGTNLFTADEAEQMLRHVLAAPKEAAEPTREASREASIRIDEIVAWLNRPANKARIEGNLRLAAEAIAELDRARRVSWEDMNTPLGVAAPRTEAAAVAPDAVANLIVRGDGTGVLMGLGGDYLSKLPKGAYPLYTHPAAPSNVREQALEEGFRKGTKEAAKILHSLADRAPPTARDIARSLYRDAARDIEALKSATPDAGKGGAT